MVSRTRYLDRSGLRHSGQRQRLGAAAAPNGNQPAFIQGVNPMGTISQTLSLNAGIYTLSFPAARRAYSVSYVQPIQVTVDGTAVGSLVSPASPSFSAFSIPFAVSTTGPHTITFTGTRALSSTTSRCNRIRHSQGNAKNSRSERAGRPALLHEPAVADDQ